MTDPALSPYHQKMPRTLVQLLKYGFFGGLSFLIFIIVSEGIELLLPEWVSESLPDAVRSTRLNFIQTAAFIPANLFAFWSNRNFVFQKGRHRPGTEFTLFMVCVTLSYIGGILASRYLVEIYGWPNFLASVGFAFSSALVNFIARKFLVFKA